MPFSVRVRNLTETSVTGADKEPLALYFKALFSNVALAKPRKEIKKGNKKQVKRKFRLG